MEGARCSEDMGLDPATGETELAETTTLYPRRIAGRPRLEKHYRLPDEVRRIYLEAHATLCNRLPILAGIGIRAIVETVCRSVSADGSGLSQMIDDLVAKGIVTPAGAEILHSLRFMGNAAAHEVKAHEEDELATAFDVVEHVLIGTFVLPRAARKLKKPKS